MQARRMGGRHDTLGIESNSLLTGFLRLGVSRRSSQHASHLGLLQNARHHGQGRYPYDENTREMSSFATPFTVSSLSVVEDIEKRRQPLRAFEAIYLLSPVEKVNVPYVTFIHVANRPNVYSQSKDLLPTSRIRDLRSTRPRTFSSLRVRCGMRTSLCESLI